RYNRDCRKRSLAVCHVLLIYRFIAVIRNRRTAGEYNDPFPRQSLGVGWSIWENSCTMSSLLPPPVKPQPGLTRAAVRLTRRKPLVKKLLGFILLAGIGLIVAAYWVNPSYHGVETQDGYSFAPVEFGNLIESISASGPISPRDVSV